MARSTQRRRTPGIEHLEARMVLTAGGPTHEATLMIDTLSRIRMNPAEAAEWVDRNADAIVQANLKHYGINLDRAKAEIAAAAPRQPLAFSPELTAAAQGHSDDMARNNFQSHQSSDGRSLSQRLDAAGYSGRRREAENAFAYTKSLSGSPDGYINNALEAFLLDWGVADKGHRRNIQEPDDHNDDQGSDEVGIGMSLAKDPIRDRAVVVQNFGTRSDTSGQLVGVVFEDLDGDGRLSYKEGRGDAVIRVRNLANDQTRTTRPWDTGMYQIPLTPGRYEVALEVNGKVLDREPLQMSTSNQKIDFNLTEVRSQAGTPQDAPSTPRSQPQTQVISLNSTAAEPAPRQDTAPTRKKSVPRTEAADKPVVSDVKDQAAPAPVRITRTDDSGSADRREKVETQMLTDLISSGLLATPSSLSISSKATWRAK